MKTAQEWYRIFRLMYYPSNPDLYGETLEACLDDMQALENFCKEANEDLQSLSRHYEELQSKLEEYPVVCDLLDKSRTRIIELENELRLETNVRNYYQYECERNQ